MVSWSIWNARNLSCFDDKYSLPIQCAFQSLGVLRYFPQENITIKTRLVEEEANDQTRPWGFFDGSTKWE